MKGGRKFNGKLAISWKQ